MFKIGEFSKLTQVTIRMLRYYDETGLLKPALIDKFSGYRYYSVEQIPILDKIIFLRDIGCTTAEIYDAINNWTGSFLSDHLKKKQTEIEKNMKSNQKKLIQIQKALNSINNEDIAIRSNISIKSVPSYKVLSLRRIIPDYFSEGYLWKDLYGYIQKDNIKLPSHEYNFAIYHDKEYKEKNVDVEICIITDELLKSKDEFIYRETEPIETMACATVSGPFENIAPAFHSFAYWLSEHSDMRMSGTSRQICHRGPWNEDKPENYLTEIQIPVENSL